MVVYAICDKFGIISLQTKSKNDVNKWYDYGIRKRKKSKGKIRAY